MNHKEDMAIKKMKGNFELVDKFIITFDKDIFIILFKKSLSVPLKQTKYKIKARVLTSQMTRILW
ncbi:hypothetical protein N476_20170 [Pseudoalteromonas luteoviolacea H33]|uniref:Uncharacterized protein n=1 Tax=Pseudoalteromonas luteoviolacea H33 TaxID=1365251 RepID=A0A167DPC9_9GAMM|nr:hypothetical protein N476_20170 [Pseudoalteromonas luteoviolacea H33]KZN73587.1 hypothetical protein N477_23070 [Pseudoalteromonas luteoviolacea H33-S]